MTSVERLQLGREMVKQAEQLPALAGLSGMLGPIGTDLYGRVTTRDPEKRMGITGRSALGGAVGSLLGYLAGIPVSKYTDVPVIPSVAGAGIGGLGGSMIGAYRGSKRVKNQEDEEQAQTAAELAMLRRWAAQQGSQ